MNIEARKIAFAQSLSKIEKETLLDTIEALLACESTSHPRTKKSH
jgi:hypothetical protein